MEWLKNEFMISDNKDLIDINVVTQLLSNTYWATDRTMDTIEKSMENSLSFGMYISGRQIGFARVVTDKAVFSWIMDVVIDDNYRGKGLGRWLMNCIFEHPEIKYTAFALATSDAHNFYKKFGFKDNKCMTRPILTTKY